MPHSISAEQLLIMALAGVCVALISGLAVYLRAQARIRILEQENTELHSRLEAQSLVAEERQAAFTAAREQLAQNFSALSSRALRNNNEQFLRLAQERLQQYQVQARADLGEREKAVEALVKPIGDALKRTEEQIRLMEQERQKAYGDLDRHLSGMARVQTELQGETRNLVKALRRPEVRGRWGEMTLRRLAELAGMVEYCDFDEQATVRADSGVQRPDMVVRMPNGRQVIIDAKTPLDAYLEAIEAPDEGSRDAALDRHARKVRERVRELAGKRYWQQFTNTPDFVVLFIPGEQFLAAAQDRDRAIMEDALGQRVIIATPTSLVALLRAVAFGWQQETVAESAAQIRELGETLYDRVVTFTDHLEKLGRSLGSSVDHFNRAIGSLEKQVLPGARRFTELGLRPRKTLTTAEPIEKGVRAVAVENSSEG
ncbi:MAG: DNA recombination protein RmuC [Aquisalimonadaceae bacterium]